MKLILKIEKYKCKILYYQNNNPYKILINILYTFIKQKVERMFFYEIYSTNKKFK